MEETCKIAKAKYETTTHHRQILRAQISPLTIDQLEISTNPSQNYRQAYKDLYVDQLQKSIHQHDTKKLKDNVEATVYKLNHIQHPHSKIYETSSSEIGNKAYQIQKPSGYYQQILQNQQAHKTNFIDYYQKRDEKFQDLINKNLQQDTALYKNIMLEREERAKNPHCLQSVLKDQVDYKQYLKEADRDKKNEQNQAFLQMKQQQKYYDTIKAQEHLQQQQAFRRTILQQMEEEKIKKNQKNKFQYNNVARHNPITNPIEYHIDNPYILKKIQDNPATFSKFR